MASPAETQGDGVSVGYRRVRRATSYQGKQTSLWVKAGRNHAYFVFSSCLDLSARFDRRWGDVPRGRA